MWITGKVDTTTQKDALFSELFNECRTAAPGAQLSYSIRLKLEKFKKEERQDIVNRTREGCTPLFFACKRGNVEIVEFLLAQCNADIEKKGFYEVADDRTIHYVTPLWCSAVAGNLPVVTCLVEHGANINSTSDSGSTPVRSACFMTNYDIVKYLVENGADIAKANFNGGTCLINSVQSVPLCEFLLRRGADVNAQDIQLKTALHYAIQEHRFETTKLLLEYQADPRQKSRYGDDALQTACLKGAIQIFEHLIATIPYRAERVAEAHELMGSTFLDDHHDLGTTVQFWRRSVNIRNADPALAKTVDPVRKRAYGHAVEFETLAELENYATDLDSMRIQSLLVCERILTTAHKDTIYRLMYRGAGYADNMQYLRCIDLWQYAFELRINKDTLLHSEVNFTAQALVRLYLDLIDKHNTGAVRDTVSFDDVFSTLSNIAQKLTESVCLLEIRPVLKRQQDNFDKILRMLSHLLYICVVISSKTEDEAQRMRAMTCSLLRMRLQSSTGDTLLHMVVSRVNNLRNPSLGAQEDRPHHKQIFPSPHVARYLLECGADPNAPNHSMSSPLHTASMQANFSNDVVDVLLEYEAHIDQQNLEGDRPSSMLNRVASCKINPFRFITLKCLSAQVIKREGLAYHGEVPKVLEGFILLH